ncbi:MAG: sporulation protein YqfD [Ruminococcaceae bacterium]|nr:sporulation protein YqfD [Oscillospiraceae bacterium]
MTERIYNYFTGWVRVKITTSQPERFLNMAVINNIYLWDIERPLSGEIVFSVSKKGFKKLRKIVYSVRGRVKILKKKGLFLFLRKLKSKKIILFGLIPLIIMIGFLSSLILEIEIIGNNSVKTDLVLEKLREINLQKFAFRSNIDSNRIALKLTREINEIAWVGVYEKGTRLTVEIKERRLPPEIVPKNTPCNIVAKKDGVIRELTVENGEALVKAGDVVKKGQVIISGLLISPMEGLRFLHSMGSVKAETFYENSLDIKLYEYRKKYTGKSFYKLYLKDYDLMPGRIIPFYNYDEEVKRYTLSLLDIRLKKYREYTLEKESVSREEAIKKGKIALEQELYSLYNKESIINTGYNMEDIDKETVRLTINASVNEDIGLQRIIRKENN